jgi:hypothetical protein
LNHETGRIYIEIVSSSQISAIEAEFPMARRGADVRTISSTSARRELIKPAEIGKMIAQGERWLAQKVSDQHFAGGGLKDEQMTGDATAL